MWGFALFHATGCIMTRQKSSFLRLGIRQKMILVLLSVLMMALGINGWLALERQQEGILKETNRYAADITRYVSRSLAFSVVGYDYHTIQLLLNELSKSKDIEYVRVSNVKGKTMAEAGSLHEANEYRVMLHEPIRLDDDIVGHLTIGVSTLSIIRNMEEQRSLLIKRESFIILLIALGEFFALSYIIVRPMGIISRSIGGNVADDGKLVSDIPIQSGDEFGDLARQFNSLRFELNHANERLQSKIEAADNKLLETNQKLLKQSLALKLMNQELQQLSITDALTGLYNRRHFDATTEADIALSHRHGEDNSLLLIDIDFFKNINDEYGHDAGDVVLKEVAAVLREHTRKSDSLCRIGGEEFAILCKRADKNGAMIIAEKLRAAIAAHSVRIGHKNISVTISIGAISIPCEPEIVNVEQFLKCADVALYQSKKRGRNRCTHYSFIMQHDMEKENVIPFSK